VDIEHFKQRLVETEREILERLGPEIDTARVTRDEVGDAGDIAQAGLLKEEYFAVAETDSAILAQVRAALRRIADGTFGTCVVDGGPIEDKRLEAVPWTPYCLKHQEELEATLRRRTPSL
jgi:DnaK suppressor protein